MKEQIFDKSSRMSKTEKNDNEVEFEKAFEVKQSKASVLGEVPFQCFRLNESEVSSLRKEYTDRIILCTQSMSRLSTFSIQNFKSNSIGEIYFLKESKLHKLGWEFEHLKIFDELLMDFIIIEEWPTAKDLEVNTSGKGDFDSLLESKKETNFDNSAGADKILCWSFSEFILFDVQTEKRLLTAQNSFGAKLEVIPYDLSQMSISVFDKEKKEIFIFGLSNSGKVLKKLSLQGQIDSLEDIFVKNLGTHFAVFNQQVFLLIKPNLDIEARSRFAFKHIAISMTYKRVYCASKHDIWVYRLSNGHEIDSLKTSRQILRLFLHPNGKILYSLQKDVNTGDCFLLEIELNKLKQKRLLKLEPCDDIFIDAVSKRLLCIRKTGEISACELASHQITRQRLRVKTDSHADLIVDLSASWLAEYHKNSIRFYNLANDPKISWQSEFGADQLLILGQKVLSWKANSLCIFNLDGKKLFSDNGEIYSRFCTLFGSMDSLSLSLNGYLQAASGFFEFGKLVTAKLDLKNSPPQLKLLDCNSDLTMLFFCFEPASSKIFYLKGLHQPQIDLFSTDCLILDAKCNRLGNLLLVLNTDCELTLWDILNKQLAYNVATHCRKFFLSQTKTKIGVITRKYKLIIYDFENLEIMQKINLNFIPRTAPISELRFAGFSNHHRTIDILFQGSVYTLDVSPRLDAFERDYILTIFDPKKGVSSDAFVSQLHQQLLSIYKKSQFLNLYFNPITMATLSGLPGALDWLMEHHAVRYPFASNRQLSPLEVALLKHDLSAIERLCKQLANFTEPIQLSNFEWKQLLLNDYGFTKKLLACSVREVKNYSFSSLCLPWKKDLPRGLSLIYQQEPHFLLSTFLKLTHANFKALTPQNLARQLSGLKQNFKQQSKFSGQGILLNETMSQEPHVEIYESGPVISEQGSILKSIPSNANTSKSKKMSISGLAASFWKSTPKKRFTMHIDDKKVNFNSLSISKKDEDQIKYFSIGCQLNLKAGFDDSLLFLQCYRKSDFSEFLFSPWRYIIDIKWQQFRYFYYVQACIFWAMTGLITYFYFNPVDIYIVFIMMLLISINIIYEIFLMFVDFPHYFKNLEKYFILCGLGLAISVVFITKKLQDDQSETNKVIMRSFQTTVLGVFFYRSLTFLKVVHYLRHIIAMLGAITRDILDIVIVIGLVILAFATLLYKSNAQITFGQHLLNTFLGFYGQITSDSDTQRNFLDYIITILMCVFLPLILFNFLIARMSNKYSVLEQQQRALHYKSKAKIISEFENIIFKFRKRRETQIQNQKKTKSFPFFAVNNEERDNAETEYSFSGDFKLNSMRLGQLQEMLHTQSCENESLKIMQKRILSRLNAIDKSMTGQIDKTFQ